MRINTVVRSDIAARYTFTLDDGLRCRAAFVRRPDKDIICLSSQIGCVGQCRFCSACNIPWVRDIRYFEMLDMVNLIDSGEKLRVHDTLVSFMGTGEPLANLDEVLRATGIFFGWGMRVAMSTSGYNLRDIGRVPLYVKMQFTLTSPYENLRKWLQPHVDSLPKLDVAVRGFKGVKELNVPLMSGYNDSHMNMEGIALWSRSLVVPVKLNHFNALNGFHPSEREEKCLKRLLAKGADAELYETDGADVFAACGQFELSGERLK